MYLCTCTGTVPVLYLYVSLGLQVMDEFNQKIVLQVCYYCIYRYIQVRTGTVELQQSNQADL